MQDAALLHDFTIDMQIAKYSPVTIKDRVEVVRRFVAYLDGRPLLAATADDLRGHQAQFAHLEPASVNIYSRHLKAFYAWTVRRSLLPRSPAEEILIPNVPRGRPHPASADALRVVFACTTGALRLAYLLAAFAGLRRGEICRLRGSDIDAGGGLATALIRGQGSEGTDGAAPRTGGRRARSSRGAGWALGGGVAGWAAVPAAAPVSRFESAPPRPGGEHDAPLLPARFRDERGPVDS